MKKLLFIASEFAPGMVPFATTVINSLAQDNRFEVHSICVNSGRRGYQDLIDKEANPIFIEYPQYRFLKLIYKFWPFKIIKTIEKARKNLKPDVIHFLTGDFTLASYIRLKCNDKFYYTVHDLHPHEIKTSSLLEKLIFKDIVWGYRMCRKTINNLTTSSYAQLAEMKIIYSNKKCLYTPFPTLVTQAMQNENRIPVELAGVKDYILFLGSVNSYKGVDLLIKAFESSKLLAKTKLIIAGKGLDYPFTSENITRLNRFIADEEVAYLFKHARLVVYPYISATMSGVLSIAYYFEKLVLVSDIQFFKENATDSVSFFKAGNINDLRERMEDMIVNPTHYHVDLDSYATKYSAKALADGYWNLYNA